MCESGTGGAWEALASNGCFSANCAPWHRWQWGSSDRCASRQGGKLDRCASAQDGYRGVFSYRRRQLGRAHVCTPVTTAHLVCRLLIEKHHTPNHICSYLITFFTY